MANTGAKLSSFPEVNDIQTGDMFPLLSGGNTNAKIDYATLARAIIAKLKSEDVVQTQTNNNNKIPSAGLVYGMNETIEDLQESTSTEQEEKSVTAEIVTVDDADGGEAGLTLNLEPTQSGSGDPSPDNVRPISGWTGAKVTRTGKNLTNIKSDNADNSQRITISGDEGDLTFMSAGEYGRAGYVVTGLEVGQRYTFSAKIAKTATSNTSSMIYLNNKAKWNYAYGTFNIGSQVKAEGLYSVTFVATTDVFFVGVYVSAGTGYPDTITFKEAQLELGSTATDYEPYQGDTYDIAFPTEAGTVYGGSLDVTTGVLTVDRTQIASYNGETLPGKWISDRDVYAAGASPTTGAQVVYELATPVTYQLTPIEVTTLLGDNIIWMDAEGTIKLDYKTNAVATKGDVNDALARIKALAKITEAIAPVESSYTATQNYVIGDYLIVDYKLYKVTAAITSGATITEGTNVTATTIMAEIRALA